MSKHNKYTNIRIHIRIYTVLIIYKYYRYIIYSNSYKDRYSPVIIVPSAGGLINKTVNELPKKLKSKIYSPKISNIDGIFFDPDNFFHLAKKPKGNLRIILYIVFIKKGNYLEKKAKELKMLKKDYLKLISKSKKFFNFLSKV